MILLFHYQLNMWFQTRLTKKHTFYLIGWIIKNTDIREVRFISPAICEVISFVVHRMKFHLSVDWKLTDWMLTGKVNFWRILAIFSSINRPPRNQVVLLLKVRHSLRVRKTVQMKTKHHHSVKTERHHSVTFQSTKWQVHFSNHSVIIQWHSVTIPSPLSNIHLSCNISYIIVHLPPPIHTNSHPSPQNDVWM